MAFPPGSSPPRASERIALVFGGATSLLGALGLAGWVTPWRELASLSAGSIPMAPRTALALLLLGGTVVLEARGRSPRRTMAVASFVLIFTGLQLARFLAGLPPIIDGFLVSRTEMLDGMAAGLMSPWTAFGLVLASLSLLLAGLSLLFSGLAGRHRALGSAAGVLALAVCLLGAVVTLGYLFGAPLLYGSPVVPMAFSTALAVACLGLALLGLTPRDSALLRPFSGSSARARLLRAFLPVAPAIVVGELLFGRVEGLNPALHAALSALLSALVVSAVVSYTARSVGRELDHAWAERERSRVALLESEQHLRLLNSLAEATRALADPEQIMAVMSRLLGEHLRASRCAYADVGKDGEQFTILHDYTDGCASTVGSYQLSLFGARAVATLNRGETLIIRNVEKELLPGEGADMFNAIGIKAIITCPLVKAGRLRALMAVHQEIPRDWTPGEVTLVQEVVERCWATIERRTAEEKLRESEALLRIAGHTALLGGWAVDLPEARITWSDEVCAIHDMPPGSAPGLEQALGFYAPQSRETLSQAFEACAREGTPFDLELEVVTAKARSIWVRSIGKAQRNAIGAITRVQGAFQDVTERKQLESQLLQAQKMEAVGRLAGGVAHDFNNVLGVILGYTELLMRQASEAQRPKLAQILAATQRASGLTQQLLAFSRKETVAPRVLDLTALLSGLEEMLGRLIGENIDLAIVAGSDLGRVKGDPGQLEQVVINLCVNARDAMPDGGLLRVQTANTELDALHVARHEPMAPGRYVMLAVSDTGSGIEKETLSKIFEPFFTTKERGKGTGLGLAMVYGVVKQMGGNVWVYSEAGQGTSVKIYLPRVDESPLPPEVQDTRMPLQGSETILLAEDEASLRAIAREILEEHGYQVIEAGSASEALAVAQRHAEPIDLLVTDVVMPGMNGRALAESLLAGRPGLRVLYMSGYTDDIIAHSRVLESGILLLEKPFSARALLERVRTALAERSS